MDSAALRYHDAEATITYITTLKHEITLLLYAKTRLLSHGFHVAPADFDHAVQSINEIVDDMLRAPLREARQAIETSGSDSY